MELFKQVIRFFKPYWVRIGFAFLFALLAGVAGTLPPYMVGQLVDAVLPNQDTQFAWWIIAAILGGYLIKVSLETLQENLQIRVGLDVITDMQLKAFTRLHRAPMSHFATTPRGDILYRLTHDVESIQRVNSSVIPRFVQQIFAAGAGIVAVLTLYWPAVVVLLILFLLYLIPSFIIGIKVRKMSDIRREKQSFLYNHIQESIEAIRLVRTFRAEDQEFQKQESVLQSWKDIAIRVALINKVYWRMGHSLQIASPGIIMLMGGFAVWNNTITPGTLMAVLGFIPIIFMPFRAFAENALVFQEAIPALHRITEYFNLPEEQEEGLPSIGEVKGHFVLNNVWFRYPQGEQEVLKGISLELKPGQHIGIAGASGGGKSTLIQLLLGLYRSEQGEILVDGKNLFDYDLNSLRRQIGVVSQETFLLNDTLEKNLRYSLPNATPEELDHAVEAAGLTQFIAELPEGYNTIVGERGLKLSGGQRQRIALARAVLRKPPILIFDEATSSLDGETENRVQEALEALIPGRTTITIAHRLSTIRHADQILVMDQGNIAEQGTHDELLAKQGAFYQLYTSQYAELEKEVAR